MQPNESTGAYSPADNRGTDSTTDSYTAATDDSDELPAAVTEFSISDAEKPADRATVGDEEAQAVWDALCDLIDERRTLPTHVRSSHIQEYIDERACIIGRAMSVFADVDAPLDVSHWNDLTSNGPSIWRVERTPMTDGGASVDGDLLDALHTEFRERYWDRRDRDDYGRSEQRVTSSELADKYDIEDAEGNPKTREAIKTLKRERGLPIIGDHAGYYIPVIAGPIEEYIESLEQRIQSIRENQELMRTNWESWQGRHEPPEDDDTDEVTVEAEFVDHSEDTVEQATDGGQDIPEDVREKIDDDPLLTVDDWLEHNGGEA